MTALGPIEISADFDSMDFHARLHEHYADWRRETPVFRTREGVVYLTRYDDCVTALTGKAFTRRPEGSTHPFGAAADTPPSALDVMISHWMIFMDPPRHDVIRSAFSKFFAAPVLESLQEVIRTTVHGLVDGLREKKEADFVSAFASPLPVAVICRLLGMPAADASLFHGWVTRLVLALDTGAANAIRTGVPAAREMHDYFTDFVKSRARQPTGGAMDALIAASAEGGLTPDELVYGCAFLMAAGYETTKDLLANGLLALSANPAALRLLREHPELVDSAVEELLRYESPFQKVSRWTRAAVPFGAYEIAPGTLVTAILGAANRDPAAFEQPDHLDLARTPNRHIAFGKGAHGCLGAMLGRMEARAAFPALMKACAHIEVRDHRWRRSSSMRGLDYLAVSLH